MSYETINIDEHIRLVQLQADQAGRLFELTDENRQYLSEFLPWVPAVTKVEDSKKHIESTLQDRATGTKYGYGVEYDGQIVGHASLMHVKEADRPAEIGYWVATDYSSKGITTEVARALTRLGLTELGLKEIVIRADTSNIGSNKVAEKAGYTLLKQQVEDGKTLNVWAKNSLPQQKP